MINQNIQAIVQELRSQLQDYYRNRLSKTILFGSQARGDAQPDSDIDILVVLKGKVNIGEEIEKTSPIVATLSLEKDVVINCIFMDEYKFNHRNGSLLRNIRQEGITI